MKKGKRMIDKKQQIKDKKKDTRSSEKDKEWNDKYGNIEKEIVSKKEMPKEEKLKMYKKLFEDIFIADIVMAFFYLINLGASNIETTVFIKDLKVFSMLLIIFTIMLFEYSYRKENGNIAIHGIECFIVSIFVLFSIYLYTMYLTEFDLILMVASIVCAIYYLGKALINYCKMKKTYLESINDINEIIKR